MPEGLENWIHRAMAIEPRDRLERAADAARALEGLGSLDATAVSVDDGGRAEDVARVDTVGAPERKTTVLAPTRRDQPALTVDLDEQTPHDEGETASAGPGGASDDGRDRDAESPPSDDFEWATRTTVSDDWRPRPHEDLPSHLVGTGLRLFGLREPPFVDRGAECDHIWQALQQVEQTGEPRVVVVAGGSGAGKSRLVDWMTTRAHELGAANILRAVHTSGGHGPGEGLPGMVRRPLARPPRPVRRDPRGTVRRTLAYRRRAPGDSLDRGMQTRVRHRATSSGRAADREC
jgi:hypothetical protein